jgi:hexosaminidase
VRTLCFLLSLAIAIFLLPSEVLAQQAAPVLNLMPLPSSVTPASAGGSLVIDPSFTVAVKGSSDPRVPEVAKRFLDDLRRQTGMLALNFHVATDSGAGQLEIQSSASSKNPQQLGEDESYTLAVTSAKAELKAATTLGVMRGLQTFLQLIQVSPQGFAVPAVTIEDKPRFPWRGLMIDSSRHFMPVEVIKRNLDGMAALKLNVFHWHLSDNQGFRVESKRFPKLQEMGSDGLYYTQDQVRDIVAYAHDRGIRVIPEFDMPGHCTAWFVGYPELASAPGPYSIGREFGIFDPAMDPTRDTTYKFLDKFIGEMAKLFPDQFFHIGGDEVNGKQWDSNPKIQDFMHAHGLKSNADLQAYFTERVQKIVAKHGKTMEGWDEILRPEIPKDILIQSWRGQKSLADAAQQGYRGILSSGYYLDLIYPTSAHYAVDPFTGPTASLSDANKEKILGGEACMWSEYVSAENVDSRIWPRMAAIAERLWSPQSVTDVNSMYVRLSAINQWLNYYGLTQNTEYDLMLRRIAGVSDIGYVRELIDLVEPVKGYSRYALAVSHPTSFTPMNRAVDAARPESAKARNFSTLVNLFIAAPMVPEVESQIRAQLTSWRDNREKLAALAPKSSFIQEVVPVSDNLSAISAAGLQALDYITHSEKPPAGWAQLQLSAVQQAFEPKAQLLLMVCPAIQKLIQFSAGEKPTELALPRRAAE